jgi:hypothetical protein
MGIGIFLVSLKTEGEGGHSGSASLVLVDP